MSERRRPTLLALDPAGQTCDACGERPATTAWGDSMTINHGGGEWRCDVCALTEQLEFARKRAAVIPELERKLAAARASLPPARVDVREEEA